MNSLEKEIELMQKEGFLKRAFKVKGKNVPHMLLSGGLAIAARYFYAKHAGEAGMSDEALAPMATLVDIGVFWGTYLPQIAYKERKEMKEKGKYVVSKIAKKVVAFGGLFGQSEIFYTGISIALQYTFQKMEISPENASLMIQIPAVLFFSGAMPLMEYSSKVGSEYLFKAFKKQPKPYK
jgi:hypothetical protein